VERHLPSVEKILRWKSMKDDYIAPSIACVEITAADLIRVGVAKST